MRQRAEQKARSRQKILHVAAGLMRQRGMSGTSVEGAMAGAGLTVGAFYAHFSDKEQLLAQAFAQALDEAKGLVDSAANGGHGADAVTAVLGSYLSAEHRDDAQHGCPLPAMLGEAAQSTTPAMRKVLSSGVETMRRRVAAVGPETLDDETALALLTLMVGGQIMARALRGTPLSGKVLTAARGAGARLVSSHRGVR